MLACGHLEHVCSAEQCFSCVSIGYHLQKVKLSFFTLTKWNLKGLFAYFQVTLPCLSIMWGKYHLNRFPAVEMCKVTFVEKPQMKIISCRMGNMDI